MSTPDVARFRARTRLVDSDHPDVVATAMRVSAGAVDDVERARRLHDFVRDEIRFGWTPAFDAQKASEVLASRVGFCNTKSTLLAALLRASGIPARVHFVTVNRKLLHGLIRPPARFVDHSYLEVFLEGRWIGIDSYSVDSQLHRAALARCRAEGLVMGYGVHTRGSVAWDGTSNAFAQFVDDGSVADLSDASFGSFVDLEEFQATGRGRNPTHLPARLLVRWLIRAANRRVTRLRSAAVSA